MKHHIRNLEILAEKNEQDEIAVYVRKMNQFALNSDEIVFSGNSEIDSVLNYQLNEAKAVLKEVVTNIKIPEDFANLFELNVILGNLLENAIYASKQTEEKYLRILLEMNKGILYLEINNSFNSDIKENNNKLESTKKTGGHGIGLANVKRIVEEKHGNIEVSSSEHRFCVRIMLYL